MFSAEDASPSMKRVYTLTEELRGNPERAALVRALTENPTKPRLGLRAANGLFASEEWWDSINSKRMPLKYIIGVIIEVYEAGQDSAGVNNTIEVRCDDGTTTSAGIYVNDPRDIELFKVGRRVSLVYALDELKDQPTFFGSKRFSEIAIEMLVSLS